MKVIPFKKQGKTYFLLDELNLADNQDGIQVATDKVRVFISDYRNQLTLKVIDQKTIVKGGVKEEKGLTLSKPAKVREEI